MTINGGRPRKTTPEQRNRWRVRDTMLYYDRQEIFKHRDAIRSLIRFRGEVPSCVYLITLQQKIEDRLEQEANHG